VQDRKQSAIMTRPCDHPGHVASMEPAPTEPEQVRNHGWVDTYNTPQWSRPRRSRNRTVTMVRARGYQRASMEPAPTEPEQRVAGVLRGLADRASMEPAPTEPEQRRL